MIFGIGVAGYYIDNLRIRGITVALLCTSNVFVANLVGLIFKEQNKLQGQKKDIIKYEKREQLNDAHNIKYYI